MSDRADQRLFSGIVQRLQLENIAAVEGIDPEVVGIRKTADKFGGRILGTPELGVCRHRTAVIKDEDDVFAQGGILLRVQQAE
jgi:hypothetical protein